MNDDAMKRQLEKIREAYDLTVEQYWQGVNPLDNIPQDIKSTSYYESLIADSRALGSGAHDVRDYLSPEAGMRFLDAGCSANLVNYRLEQWPSTYYGVDISPALVDAMKEFTAQENIGIGGLYVADIAGLPFDDNFFDIATVIGVLEYGTLEYIGKALMELNRVCKPEARVVLDIPNREHPHAKDMARLEEYLGRPIYHYAHSSIEELLAPIFAIERTDNSRLMIKYYVRVLK